MTSLFIAPSFRLRLALLSALLSGLVLAVFGFGSLWLIRNIQLEKIQTEIRANAERQVARIRNTDGWQFAEGSLSSTQSQLAQSMGLRDANDLLLLVQSDAGKPIFRSSYWPAELNVDRLPWPKFVGTLLPNSELGPAVGQAPAFTMASLRVQDQTWHIALAVNDRVRIAIAVNERIMESDMHGTRNAFLLALPLALVLIGAGSWFFSGRALAPVEKLTEAAHRVTAEGLHYRISAKGEDREFSGLIEVFNRMLERLERSFHQAYRFSADAAHELKTPLAIVQGQLERAIEEAPEASPMQANLSSILDEVRRLSTISRKLLLLAQADAGKLNVLSEPIHLSALLEDLLEDTRMLAPTLPVSGDIQPGLRVKGDASLLRQVLHNLVSNAIKYNTHSSPPGWIHISTTHTAKRVKVHVSNASHGIPTELHDKVFERFFRVDSAHSRHIEGVGLGLSVSREIARAHGGDLLLQANSPGTVQFTLVLPV